MKIAFCALLLSLPALSFADMTIKCANGAEFKAKKIAITKASDSIYLPKAMVVAARLTDGSVHDFSEMAPYNVQCFITSDTADASDTPH